MSHPQGSKQYERVLADAYAYASASTSPYASGYGAPYPDAHTSPHPFPHAGGGYHGGQWTDGEWRDDEWLGGPWPDGERRADEWRGGQWRAAGHADVYGPDAHGEARPAPPGAYAYAQPEAQPPWAPAAPSPAGSALPRQAAPEPGRGREPSPAPPAPGGRAAARRARKAAERPESLRRLLPQALVVAFLAGGTSAFVAHDKEVQLTVDGEPRTLHTFAGDVAGVLQDAGVRVGEHDAVTPGPEEAIADGDRVSVRFGRPLVLTLDGRRQRVWTTAPTVEEALRRLGVRTEGAYLSVPRRRAVDRRGLELTVRTERSVTFLADGRERTLRTNAATVREALAESGIELRGEDTTSVPLDAFPRDGQTVTVMRVTHTERIREEPIAFATVRREDPALYAGTEVVEQAGRQGVRRITYRLRTVNGVARSPRHVSTEVIREPTPRIVKVGTRPLPESVEGADGLDWEALARCESGGRPDAVDPTGTHGGLYQFDLRTWRSVGGTGRPEDASPAEQTYRAKKLYARKGTSPWPVCGRRLHR